MLLVGALEFAVVYAVVSRLLELVILRLLLVFG